MKLFSTLAFTALLASVTSAQRVLIGYPPDGSSVTAGSSVVVEIDRPDTLSGSTEVAIVVGLVSCASSECRSPDDGLGTVLYNGGYKPEFQPTAPFFKPPHQNFTVVIPSSIPKGKAQLGVLHVSLIGALLAPFSETLNVTLNVV